MLARSAILLLAFTAVAMASGEKKSSSVKGKFGIKDKDLNDYKKDGKLTYEDASLPARVSVDDCGADGGNISCIYRVKRVTKMGTDSVRFKVCEPDNTNLGTFVPLTDVRITKATVKCKEADQYFTGFVVDYARVNTATYLPVESYYRRASRAKSSPDTLEKKYRPTLEMVLALQSHITTLSSQQHSRPVKYDMSNFAPSNLGSINADHQPQSFSMSSPQSVSQPHAFDYPKPQGYPGQYPPQGPPMRSNPSFGSQMPSSGFDSSNQIPLNLASKPMPTPPSRPSVSPNFPSVPQFQPSVNAVPSGQTGQRGGQPGNSGGQPGQQSGQPKTPFD